MVIAAKPRASSRCSAPAPTGKLTQRLAAAAGVAAIGGGEALAVTYVPTAGVVAAQGIPGFSFVDASNVTLGALRPPVTVGQDTSWDVDGTGTGLFNLWNWNYNGKSAVFSGTSMLRSWLNNGSQGQLKNLTQSAAVGPLLAATRWSYRTAYITINGQAQQQDFSSLPSGQFGFRIIDAPNTYYGWGSLLIDGTPQGQGFAITEAYYNTTPGASINVGAVPQAVPEPSSMALLGLGAAGVVAWRARRKVARGAAYQE